MTDRSIPFGLPWKITISRLPFCYAALLVTQEGWCVATILSLKCSLGRIGTDNKHHSVPLQVFYVAAIQIYFGSKCMIMYSDITF